MVRGQKGTGKGRGRRGIPKGGATRTLTGGYRKGTDRDRPPPPHRTDTNRAERRVKKDPLIETPEGEGEEGYLLRYTPNQEDLQIKEAYG